MIVGDQNLDGIPGYFSRSTNKLTLPEPGYP